MATKIQPLDDRILIRPLEAEEKTPGGIVLPDTAKEKPQQGKIMAVGSGRLTDKGKRIPPEVKVGDTVIFGKYSGDEVHVGDDECKIIRESDILAVLV
ncbi:MAG: co-chaperone GroES [Planctomycetes bacterium]|nr:co-chaperone GroES [Planctomycetota bacterium]